VKVKASAQAAYFQTKVRMLKSDIKIENFYNTGTVPNSVLSRQTSSARCNTTVFTHQLWWPSIWKKSKKGFSIFKIIKVKVKNIASDWSVNQANHYNYHGAPHNVGNGPTSAALVS